MAKRGNPNWIAGGPSPNPSGKARTDAAPPATAMGGIARMVMQHFDGYMNAQTGLGIRGKDKTVGAFFQPDVIDAWTAENIYRGDPIAARMIDMVPNDATAEQPELCIGDYEAPDYYKPEKPALPSAPQVMPGKPLRKDARAGAPARPLNSWERRVVQAIGRARRDAGDMKALSEEIENRLGRGQLNAMHAISQAIKYRDAYGGAAILIGANDYTTDMRQPLDLKRVRGLNYLTVLESRELMPLYFYNDPFAPDFGKVAMFQLVPWRKGASIDPNIGPNVTQIHSSRLIVFDGPRVSERQLAGALPGWGDSKYTRVGNALKSYAASIQNIDVLLSDFAQAVYKIKGLAASLLQNPNALTDAMMGIELARSICRAVIIDEGEEFKRESTSLAGYADMVDRLALNVTVASDIPHTRLFGTSAKGLNATGEGDDRFYFGGVSKMQTHVVAPAYLRLVEIEMAARGIDPQQVTHSVAFKPLWQPTELEIAQTRLAVAQADHIYITDEVVSREEVALSRFGGDGWSMETHLDIEARAQEMSVMPPPVNATPEPEPDPEDPNDPDGENQDPDSTESFIDPKKDARLDKGGAADQQRDNHGRFGTHDTPIKGKEASTGTSGSKPTASSKPTRNVNKSAKNTGTDKATATGKRAAEHLKNGEYQKAVNEMTKEFKTLGLQKSNGATSVHVVSDHEIPAGAIHYTVGEHAGSTVLSTNAAKGAQDFGHGDRSDEAVSGARILVHETLHGYSPIHPEAMHGKNLWTEEVTTEMAARQITNRMFGAAAGPGQGSYHLETAAAATAVTEAHFQAHNETLSRKDAFSHVAEASIRFKQRGAESIKDADHAFKLFSEDLAHVTGTHADRMHELLTHHMEESGSIL